MMLATLLVAAFVGVVFGFQASRSRFPFGYAGLYTLMAQLIADHGLQLTNRVPFYGPGGMPFAYPPLGLYLMAGTLRAAHISAFSYLRFAPVILTTVAAFPLVLLYRRVSRSETRAVLGAFFALTTPNLLIYQIFADGVVRSFAYLWTIVGILLAYRALHGTARICAPLSALCFGLTIVSHPSNPVFFVITVVIFAAFAGNLPRASAISLGILVGGAVAASPWWLVILGRYGYSAFGSAFHTHGGVGVVGLGFGQAVHARGALGVALFPLIVLLVLGNSFIPLDPRWLLEYGLAFYGFWFCLLRREWLVPVWLVASVLLMPDGERFWASIIALLAATALCDFGHMAIQLTSRVATSKQWPGFAFIAGGGVIIFTAWSVVGWASSQRAPLSRSDLRAAAWVQKNSAVGSTFLTLTASMPEAEWFPYLLHRTPAIAPWGAEWTGKFNLENELFGAQASCLELQSLPCLQSLIRRHDLHVTYILLKHRSQFRRLDNQLTRSGVWLQAFADQDDAIWMHQARTRILFPLPGLNQQHDRPRPSLSAADSEPARKDSRRCACLVKKLRPPR